MSGYVDPYETDAALRAEVDIEIQRYLKEHTGDHSALVAEIYTKYGYHINLGR